MSAEAAPAAATTPSTATPPAPNTAPTATGAGPRPGLLASMVAPVEPARTTFTLTPDTAAPGTPEGGSGTPAGGVSSAAFHDTTTPDSTKTTNPSGNGAGKPKQGMIRALVLAAATRWAKGGGTANKRLDMHKARAQADQVKETRQVTVNRTPAGGSGGGAGAKGPGGGGGGRGPKPSGSTGPGGGQGGKSLDRKSSGGHTKNSGAAGPKNNTTHTKPTNGPAGTTKNRNPRGLSGPDGRSNTGSSHGGGGKDTNRGRTNTETATPKPVKTKDASAAAPKNNTKTNPGTTTGAKGSTGGTGKPGKDGKTPPTPKTPTDTTNGKNTPAGPRIPKQTTNDKTPGDTNKTPKPDSKTKPDLTKKKGQEPKAPTKGNGNPAKPTPATETTGNQDKPETRTTPTAGPTKRPLATQPSRETGYRDGTRAAKATAHARAYRDGLKDGWNDTLAAAHHEKTLLDQAHAERRNTRESEPTVTTPTTSSADHHTEPGAPNPIQVTGIDAKNLHLGDGASRTTISRGEVRSLKQFERRLEDRLTTLQKTADTTKQLQAHAEGQAQQAQNLLEQARGVKGGDKLASALSRLTEDAKKQAVEAGEIHKRAVRSADACAAVLANVSTRYGGMYQAVVDSPETVPAELAYYQGA
ncbi:collagen-like domain-containing protein [Streptomyces californicus]|uniref:hypothetical protein n=1 Tax=Streptomyces californicus TaxID=67351 RepID=UPI00067DBF54|nr:hypothetical protein [Streptomyces californicus]QRV59352.1 hypothetical protein I6J40_34390 [Streptomyces californicus]